MKKLIIIAASVLATMAFPEANLHAQGLGGLLNKAKEKIGQVTGQTETSADQITVSTLSGDASVLNPVAQFMDVTPIGLYGISESENSGNLYLVIRVTNKTEKPSALFGSSIKNQNMVAVDGSGKVFNINSSGAMRFDTPQDIPVKIELSSSDYQFVNVSKNTTVMPMVKVGINIDAQRQGVLTLKNLPVYWDNYPE